MTDAATKRVQVRAALDRGELVLVYDPEAESCNILPADQVPAEPTG